MQQQQSGRGAAGGGGAASGSGSGAGGGEWLLDMGVNLLLTFAHGDSVVLGHMAEKNMLQMHLDLLNRMGGQNQVKAMRAMRWLTGEASVLPGMKDAGAVLNILTLTGG